MELTYIFLKYLFANVATIVLFYFIGTIFLYTVRFTDKSPYLFFFLKLLAGMIFFIALTAITSTKGQTIFFGLLLLWIILYYLIKTKKGNTIKFYSKISLRKEIKIFFETCLALLLFFSLRFYSFTEEYNGFLNIPQIDFAYYAHTSYNLLEHGVETSIYNFYNPTLNKIDPYHYADLWLNGGLSLLFKETQLITLTMVTQTVSIVLVWLAFCVLVEAFKIPTTLDKIMAWWGTFLTPLLTGYVYFVNSLCAEIIFLKTSPPIYFVFSLWNNPKLFVIYILLIVSIVFLMRRNWQICVALLLTCTFMHTITYIPICGGLLILLIIQKKFFDLPKRTFVCCLTLFIFTIIYISTFYIINNNDLSGSSMFEVIQTISIEKLILRPFLVFFETCFQTVLLFLFPAIFAIIFLVDKWKTSEIKSLPLFIKIKADKSVYTPPVLLIILLLLISIATWSAISFLPDAPQIYGNIGIVALNMLVFIVFVLGASARKFIEAALCIFLFCIISLNSFDLIVRDIFEEKIYSDKFMKQISTIVNDLPVQGAYIRSKQDHINAVGHPNVDILGQFLFLFRSDFEIEPLSVYDTHYSKFKSDSVLRHHAVKQSNFYRFVEKQKLAGEFHSIGQSQINYMDANGISFLVSTNNTVLDSLIIDRIDSTIRDDVYSGQVLHILKRPGLRSDYTQRHK
jgi:hypothetical protein